MGESSFPSLTEVFGARNITNVNRESEARAAHQAWEREQQAKTDQYLHTPAGMLYTATITGNITEMEYLMNTYKLKPTTLVRENKTHSNREYQVLAFAVLYGQAEAAEFLIDKGANVNLLLGSYGNEDSGSILTLAAGFNMRIAKKILSKRLSPQFVNAFEYHDVYYPAAEWNVQLSSTALTIAILSSNIEVVQLLIQAGADINLGVRTLKERDRYRYDQLKTRTPIELALQEKQYEIAALLKQAGATRPSLYNIRNDVDINTFNWVFQHYPTEFGLPPDYTNTMGKREILFTISNLRKPEILHDFFSISYASVINDINSDGNTIVMVAAMNNNLLLVQYALRDGAKTAIKRADGNTALHLAAISASTKTGSDKQDAISIVELLVRTNPMLTKIRNKQGYLARDPRLGVTKEITDLIYSKTPWFAKNADKKGGARKTGVRKTGVRKTQRTR